MGEDFLSNLTFGAIAGVIGASTGLFSDLQLSFFVVPSLDVNFNELQCELLFCGCVCVCVL